MDWGEIRKLILRSRLSKTLLIIFIVIMAILYIKTFFTVGIRYDDVFLKKEVVGSESHYKGSNIYGNFHITVEGQKDKSSSANVIYRLPNNISAWYTVKFKDASNWDLGIKDISIMDEKGNIIFEGKYIKDTFFLYDKNGEPMVDEVIRVRINDETLYNEDYKIPLKNIADLATFSDDTIRGRYEFLIMAVFLFIYIGIDIKFPLFFFNLRYWLAVENPEPSDFYIAMQKISWVVVPIIGIILLIAAIV